MWLIVMRLNTVGVHVGSVSRAVHRGATPHTLHQHGRRLHLLRHALRHVEAHVCG